MPHATDDRPARDDVFMAMAALIATRGTCARDRVGALITDADGLRVLALGYNGAAAGEPHGCRRDTPGDCGCVHAELNALLKHDARRGAVLYTTRAPCERCAAAIVNARVARVVYLVSYRDPAGLVRLERARVRVTHHVASPSATTRLLEVLATQFPRVL